MGSSQGLDDGARTAGPAAWPERVDVFLHVATLGRYQEVLDEVLAAIVASPVAGLARAIEVRVVGDGPVATPPELPNLRVVRVGPDVKAFEFPTLAAVRRAAIADPRGAILYLNCLGGRHVGSGFALRRAWRALIAFELLERAPACLVDLKKADVVGIEWAESPLPHMTSNNWWARADYIARLPEPTAFAEAVAATTLPAFGANWDEPAAKRRHAGEYWIGAAAARPVSRFPLAQSGLPISALGHVPWWGLPGVDWADLARRRADGRPPETRQRAVILYYRALFLGRRISRLIRAVTRSGGARPNGRAP